MEKVVRIDGRIYYGREICSDVDHAYRLLRDDYHRELGKAVYRRLNRLGRRKERVHGFGYVFEPGTSFPDFPKRLVPARLLGIAAGAYCRSVDGRDLPCGMGDDEFWQWVDWAFRKGAGIVRLVGRKEGYGRTSKRLNKRFR